MNALHQNWHVWLVTLILVVAAVIDGYKLKVPNWITFPMIAGGWAFSAMAFGGSGLAWSLTGTAVGLALLLPAYAIGAWVWGTTTFYAFCVSAVVGGVIAVGMVLHRRAWSKHRAQFEIIVNEVLTLRDPEQLAAIAAERKSSMLLLPYGIPIAIGTIAYFAWTGMLI